MTARDSLVPAVCERDGRSLQKFMGLTQSLDSLVVIAGPALAAFLMGAAGSVNALWFTAAMSLSAALLTLTLPRSLGAVCGATTPAASPTGVPAARAVSSTKDESRRGLLPDAWQALRDGAHVLFASDTLLRSSMLISFGIVMVMGLSLIHILTKKRIERLHPREHGSPPLELPTIHCTCRARYGNSRERGDASEQEKQKITE